MCHQVRSYKFSSRHGSNVDPFDFLHARLFCLFIDVICVFAEDFVSLDSVVERLKAWAAIGCSAHLTHQIRPRVVIVVKGEDASPTYDLLQAEDLRFNLHQQDLIGFFSSITILRLADAQISPLARYRRLKEVLWRHSDEVRQLRQSLRCLFSASHLSSFFSEIAKETAEGSDNPRNFVILSRYQNRISESYSEHLLDFFDSSQGIVDRTQSLVMVASSIVMDAYPPGMHGKMPIHNLHWARANLRG